MSHSQLLVLFLQTVQIFSIFGCKEYNQSVFGTDHLVMSMCRAFSCVVGRGLHSLSKTLLAFALLHFAFQGKICCYSRYLLTSYFCISVPYDEKDTFFGCQFQNVLQIVIELVSFFSISGWVIDLDYCDIEWFALEMNRDHSVVFEAAPKYCIQDSFVDYKGFSSVQFSHSVVSDSL